MSRPDHRRLGTVRGSNPSNQRDAAKHGATLASVFKNLRPGQSDDSGAVEQIAAFAKIFDQPGLLAAVETYRAAPTTSNKNSLETALEDAKRDVSSSIRTLQSGKEAFLRNRRTARVLRQVSTQMQDQAKTRLAHLQSCLAQERRWFEEDIDRLAADAANAIEVSLRDLTDGRSWTDKALWEQQGRSAVDEELRRRVGDFEKRWQQRSDQWAAELRLFDEDIASLRRHVLGSVEEQNFGELLSPLSMTSRAMDGVSRGIGSVFNFGKKTALGGAIGGAFAVQTGVVQLGTLIAGAAQVAGALATPIGLSVSAVVGAATVYQKLYDSDKRKVTEIKSKRSEITKQMRTNMRATKKKWAAMMSDYEENLSAMLDRHFTPLYEAVEMMEHVAALEEHALDRVLASTEEKVQQLSVSP